MAAVASTRRRRMLAAGLCLAMVAVAVLVPGVATLDCIVFELPWVLLRDTTIAAAVVSPVGPSAQPPGCLSLLPSRAPPVTRSA